MINKAFFIITIAFYAMNVTGQDYYRVDSMVSRYSKSISKPELLADKINHDFSRDADKALAIYTWMAKSIRYDVEAYFSKNYTESYEYENKEEKIEKELLMQDEVAQKTMKKKLAVCYGYSVLYKKLCDLCDIQCVIITGGAKTKISQIGKMPPLSGHAWNAVKMNDKWELVDVTWGAGYVDGKNKTFVPSFTKSYFFTSPDKFFYNHFPKDSVWFITNKTRNDFMRFPLFYTDYFESGIELIYPLDGELEVNKGDSIHIKVAKYGDKHAISYAFSNEKYSNELVPKWVSSDLWEFSILNTLSKNGTLTIYYDNKAMISYKIK